MLSKWLEMLESDVPVLILGYLRFDGIQKILLTCKESGIKRVYLALDGAKNEITYDYQEKALQEIIKYAGDCDLSLTVRRRHSNAGLAVAVIEGISWFFENENFGIILEDDLEVSPPFFTYVASACKRYEEQDEIFLISGNNYFADELNSQINATHYPLIWGWATWRNRWSEFLISLEKIPKPFNLGKTSLSVNSFWLTAALQSRFGIVDSWAMSLSHYLRAKNKICILPPQNLVSNLGADAIAEHSNESDIFIKFPTRVITTPIQWGIPSQSEISEYDSKLELVIYRISLRNLLSPLKFLLTIVRVRRLRPIKDRLKDLKAKTDFTILSRGL